MTATWSAVTAATILYWRSPDAEAVAGHIAGAIRGRPYAAPDGAVIPLFLPCGVAVAPEDGATRRELPRMAGGAMDAARRGALRCGRSIAPYRSPG